MPKVDDRRERKHFKQHALLLMTCRWIKNVELIHPLSPLSFKVML